MDPDRALRRLRGEPVDRIPHWEHLSNPEFLRLMSGLDPYEHPRQAALKTLEQLPIDMGGGVPATDDPIEPLAADAAYGTGPDGSRLPRWGSGVSSHWEWGSAFTSVEQALAYQPLEHLDLRHAPIVAQLDYSRSVEDLAWDMQGGDLPPKGGPRAEHLKGGSFYNTLFMWPLLTFGWEIFLELAGAHKAEMKRLLADFACLSRKVFQAAALTDINYFVCHDDICMARGPVCSPAWLREFIYPYYEEFFGYMKEVGIIVIFMTDGNPDLIADDVFACGADGLISEPFGNYEALARRYPDKMLAGDGDNRVLMSRDRDAIERMTRRMCELGRRQPRYLMCIGNHIPWNVPPEAVKWYFEFSDKYGRLE
ncbi:MAG: uroporphyrinogen decarboxylase family protein [Armatimonadota bacterium]